jgi:hypothetical protein
MRLLYLSIDELNRSLVRAWCEPQGIDVECPMPKDRAWGWTFDGLVVDLDHTTSDWLGTLAQVLENAQHAPRRVIIHGSSIAADAFRRAFAFRGPSVTVCTRICPEFLRQLARDIRASAPSGVEDQGDELTWVDLV